MRRFDDYVHSGVLYSAGKVLTHECLKILLEIVVWTYDSFDYNFGLENDFTKYMKESCW